MSRLTSAVNENGAVGLSYDSRGRLKTSTDVFGHLVEYAYDAVSNRTQVKLDSAVQATYNYDAANRLTTLTDAASQNFVFGYDIANRLISKSIPNGVTTTFDYDGMSRLTRLKDATSSSTLFDRQYSYNPANQISQIAEPSQTRNFGYDNVDRLISMTNGTSNESYGFDGVGNRTASHLSPTYNYQPFNRMTSTSTATMNYDPNGNLVTKSEGKEFWRFTWDYESRMVSAATRKQTVRYKYDALGRRIQRIAGKGRENTKFIYDGADIIVDDNNGTLTKYLNGPGIDNKLRVQTGSDVKYFLSDHLGSTNALTDGSGNVTSSATYDSFGNATGNLATRYKFTGREFDDFTGLHYYRARWYDSNLGRFISEDPIGFAGGDVNLYGYVGNGPLGAVDPFGLYETDVHYYLTYYLALKTGCFSDGQARAIANGDQLTDEDPHFSPDLGKEFSNGTYHALNSEARPGEASKYLAWRTSLRRNNYLGVGRELHYLQDTYSHAGYPNSFYGHARAFHYYDKTDSDPERAMRMAGATWGHLKQFARTNGCECDAQWTREIQDTVWRFVRTPSAALGALNTIDSQGGIADFGITNSPLYLDRKRQVLGVSVR